MNNTEILINNLSMIEKLYDVIRIIDPINKKVLKYEQNILTVEEDSCFSFWKRYSYCENCISMRALNESNTFVKIEYNKEKIYMIMASPVYIGNNKYIVETLKDITSTGVIHDLENKSINEISREIKKMNDHAIKDELTDVFNKRYIKERLPIDILKNFTEKTSLSLIMADIDYFKEINDTFGHLAGDFILTKFAWYLKENIREDMDWIARYGGEEFLIVLNNVNEEKAFKIANRMRKFLEKHSFIYENNKINITSSFGVYSVIGKQLSIDELLKEVDKNLYKAKNSGRNIVIK